MAFLIADWGGLNENAISLPTIRECIELRRNELRHAEETGDVEAQSRLEGILEWYANAARYRDKQKPAPIPMGKRCIRSR